ncbi:hypothetical protein PPERSA_05885 [Pseudocohnilembus persalinus]|uniref:Polycystin cation channel PKD1/PKD2 domain-containing protein n=1 Tax=Pseudocohnilembus persalinus TaxID=266149 RepID=A0A0V0R4E5_PSEPJ|nr:hypothetical protein PPERSA_05885 [Pseudocohnilembus persalinus]|eukprot:KRX09216.1 hypothetical protein PPERSA_05885 [Pseudocohnilembus persalinus]
MTNVFRHLFIDEEFLNKKWLYDIEEFQESIQQVQDVISDLDGELLPETNVSNMKVYIDVYYEQFDEVCYLWDISLDYNFQTNTILELSMFIDNGYCVDDQSGNTGVNFLFIHILVFIFAFASLILAIKYVLRTGQEYMERKQLFKLYKKKVEKYNLKDKVTEKSIDQRLDEQTLREFFDSEFPQQVYYGDMKKQKPNQNYNLNWEQLNLLDKLSFFNIFFLLGILTNSFQIFGALVSILEAQEIVFLKVFLAKEALMGTGAALQWFVMLNYLKFDDSTNLMNETLSRSGAELLYFMIGCLPIFIGTAQLCMMIFPQETFFQSFADSAIVLVAMGLGDIIYDVFEDTVNSGFIGHIVLMMFLVFFYTAVQNVFIAIIMDCYDEMQNEKQQKYDQQFERKVREQEYYQNYLRNINQIEDIVSKIPQEAQTSDFMQSEFQYQGVSPGDVLIAKIQSNVKQISQMIEMHEEFMQDIDLKIDDKTDKIYLYSMMHKKLKNVQQTINYQQSTSIK